MNPVRKQRLIVAALIIVAAGIAATLIAMALQQNMTYLHTPSETHEGAVPQQSAFRMGGVVKEGSVQRTQGSLEVRFDITDRVTDFPVRYSGILPDLFREGQSVIARGRLESGVFVADEVLAKHDETYMPPEVAEKIAESHAKAAQLKQEAVANDAPAASNGATP